MPERDELDLLIDSALRDYAEPRAGLVQRMLARIPGSAARPSQWRWLLAAIVAPAIVALIFVDYLIPKAPQPQPGQPAYAPAIASAAPNATAPALPPSRKALSMGHIWHRERITRGALNDTIAQPKLDVFPTPQPPNAEEQALIRFANDAPEADRRALAETQQRLDEPLTISAIRIPPLRSPEENPN